MPLAKAFGISRDLLRSLPHQFQICQFRDPRSVEKKVTQIPLESGGVAKVDGDDPPARAIFALLLSDCRDGPQHGAFRLEQQVLLRPPKNLLLFLFDFLSLLLLRHWRGLGPRSLARLVCHD